MIFGEFVKTLTICFVKNFKYSEFYFFIKDFDKSKNFFEIENFVVKNGLLGGKLIIDTLKSLLLIRRFIIFLLKLRKKMSKNNCIENLMIFSFKTYSSKSLYFFLSRFNVLKPKNLGQLIWFEGNVLEISIPFIKKFSRKNIFQKKSQIEKKGKEKSKKENHELIKYQELKIFPSSFLNSRKEIFIGSQFLVFLKKNMVEKFFKGTNLSILGMVKRRYQKNNKKICKNSKIYFIIEAIFVESQKKKNTWDRQKKEISVIDFKSIWQDCKIRNNSFLTRNLSFKILFRRSKTSKFSKFLISLFLIGTFQPKTLKNFKKKHLSNCIIISKENSRKKFSSKPLHNFWFDSIYLKTKKIPKKKYIYSSVSKKKEWEKKKAESMISRLGILFIDQGFFSTYTEKNLFLYLKKNFFFYFFGLKSVDTNKPRWSILLSFFKREEFDKFGKDYLIKKKKLHFSLAPPQFYWDDLFLFFDFFIFQKNFQVLFDKKKKRSTEIIGLSKKLKKEYLSSLKEKKIRKWKKSSIRSFFFFSKTFIVPNLSKDARNFLLSLYFDRNSYKIFPIKKIINLEKIIKISQTYSRYFYRDCIQPTDIIFSIFIIVKNFELEKKLLIFMKKKSNFRENFFLMGKTKFKILIKKIQTRSWDDFFGLCGGNFK